MLNLNRNRTATALKKIWCLFCTDGSSKGNNNVEIPPEPTNCCMSGCPNCVWIEYATLLAQKFNDSGEKARKVILDKITDPNMKAFLSMELRNMENRPK